MEGSAEQIINYFTEIAEQNKQSVNNLKNNKVFKFLAENVKDIIFLQDLNLNIIYVSTSVEEISGYKPEEIIGENMEGIMTDESFTEAREIYLEYLNRARQLKDIEIPLMEYKYFKKDGSVCWGEFKPTFIYDSTNNPIAILGIWRDITMRKKKEEEIKYLSFHDHLTGLYNRRYFENEIDRLNKSRRLPASIIVADMDGLKHINDSYGHKIGDEFIKSTASIFKNSVREEDVLARIGGDEFSVILPKTDVNTARKLCDRIKNECNKFNQRNQLPEKLEVSFGYSTKVDQSQDLNEIFDEADKKMYKNKKRKRG